jgi:hypothetical protein
VNFFSILRILFLVLFTIWAIHGVITLWRRRGAWRGVLYWIAAVVVAYVGFIAVIAGPASKFIDRLPGAVVEVVTMALAVGILLALCEVIFRAMDGPFPQLTPVSVYRPKVYRLAVWLIGLLLLVLGVRSVAPEAWRENLGIAAGLGGLFIPMGLWFQHYRARRFDYGMAALMANPWVHWEYPDGELENFTGLDPRAPQDAWIGPAGLIYVGDFAPWNLSVYELRSAVASMAAPARITFSFKKTGFGNSTAEDVMRVAIPTGRASDLATIDRELRAICPRARIELI